MGLGSHRARSGKPLASKRNPPKWRSASRERISTMSGYEDLSIGALKRAAIDAYMKNLL
jgi:hypothetical protein